MKRPITSVRCKVVLLSVFGILALYSLLGFLVIPAVLSHQIPKLVQEKSNRIMQVQNIQFNPFSMELNVLGLEAKNLDGSIFVSFQRFYTNVAVLDSIVDLSLKMDQLLLEQPYFSVKRDKQGNFNFTDLLVSEQPENEKQPTDENIFPVTISQISIADGKLSWEDNYYSQSHQEDIHPLNLDIQNFTTLVNKQSKLGFSLMFASGGKFNWEGNIKLNPFSSQGHIKLDSVNFHRVWELFLQDTVNFELLKGSELIEADYNLSDINEGMQLVVDKALIDIYDFQLSKKGQTDALITIPDFKVSGITVNFLKKEIAIAEVITNDARFKTWLNADGSINFQTLFTSGSENQPVPQQNQTTGKREAEPWHFSVKQLAVKNFALQFTDKTLKNPAQLNLSSLNFNVTGLTDNMQSELPFNLSVKINEAGSLNIAGKTVPKPFSTVMQIDAGKISIKDFQPYIDQYLQLDIISGLLNINADVSIQQALNKPLAISFKGGSNVTDFVSRDRISNRDFLNWKQLSLNNMNLDLASNNYNIDKVRIEYPYSRVLIRKDKSINIKDILIDTPQQEKPPVKSEQNVNRKQPEPSFKITRIEMLGGESDFADLSLILPFSAHISQLKGSITGFSSDSKAVAKVALAGRVHDLAPVNIVGQITPHNGNSEIALDFNSMPLPLMTPYMAEFAGRKIEKGNMSLGLKYTIQSKQLSASNNLLIDQLVLGEKVENPDAVSLPLELAIALLEDSNGKIALDVPITGSLDNPEFSIADIVIDALVNVITKVITAPFNALAALIGSDEDVSQISFSAGKALLTEKQREKLEGLANALQNRPGLKLEIKGKAYSEFDWPPLQTEALEKQLLQIRSEELNKDSKKKILAENIKLSEEDYQRLLADLFIQKFPQLAERSFFGTARLIDPKMGDFYQTAKVKLAAIIPPDRLRLQELATMRAQTIAKYLLKQKIAVDRLYLLDVEVDPKKSDRAISTTLSLAVN